MYLFFKRLVDLLFSLILLTILVIPFAIVAILIKLDSKGPVFFLQERIGKNKEVFKIYKFRTMVINAEKLGGTSTKRNDYRITKFGAFLRKTSIDELPQLINVFKGNMSLVGYRPGVSISNNDTEYQIIFNYKPGITGLAQISGRSLLTPQEKRILEISYAKNISFTLDCRILLLTIPSLLNKKTAF